MKTVPPYKYNRTAFSVKHTNYEKSKHLNNEINELPVEHNEILQSQKDPQGQQCVVRRI